VAPRGGWAAAWITTTFCPITITITITIAFCGLLDGALASAGASNVVVH
jgi:hypothetical protein